MCRIPQPPFARQWRSTWHTEVSQRVMVVVLSWLVVSWGDVSAGWVVMSDFLIPASHPRRLSRTIPHHFFRASPIAYEARPSQSDPGSCKFRSECAPSTCFSGSASQRRFVLRSGTGYCHRGSYLAPGRSRTAPHSRPAGCPTVPEGWRRCRTCT